MHSPRNTTHAATLQSGAIPSLDGVRAVAVALVFFAHGGWEDVVPGGLGVTIFFVLSGYLISTLLRMEYASTGRVDFRNFYLRRLLRLMPPLLLVVAICAVLAIAGLLQPFTTNGLFSVLFYYGNYFVIANDFHGLPAGLGVVWSLAVEEHYYLFYPPLAALLLRINRTGLSATALSTLCVAILAWRCWLALQGTSAEYISMASDTRIDAILIGCLLALSRNPWLDKSDASMARPAPDMRSTGHGMRKLMPADFGWIGLSLALLLATLAYRNDFFRMTFRYTVQSIAVAVLLYYAVARSQAWPFRWLNKPLPMYIGAISYTIYLSHHVIMQFIGAHWPQQNRWVSLLLTLAITLAFAASMRKWVEQPCANLRRRLHAARPTATPPVFSQAASGGTL